MRILIECQNISKFYGKEPNQTKALHNASFSVEKGKSIALIGPSGCGKTTLLNVLSLLIRPDEGTYSYQGMVVNHWNERQRSDFRNREIGFIVQDFALLENETAQDNVQLPLLYSKDRLTRNQRRKRIQQMLDKVNMGAHRKQVVRTMSGGQRQRIAIARALINNPNIILADEPTGALDTENQEQIFRILMDLVAEGRTLIMATHNVELANRCSRKLYMLNGMISEYPMQMVNKN